MSAPSRTASLPAPSRSSGAPASAASQAQALSRLLLPGHIVHVRTHQLAGLIIRRSLSLRFSDDLRRHLPSRDADGNGMVWGNHDALVVEVDGRLCIGDAQPPRACCTPLATYARHMAMQPWNPLRYQVRILRPLSYTPELGRLASAAWLRDIRGRPYDYWHFPRLLLRCIFGERFNWALNLRSKFCTQGVSQAWLSAGLDLYSGNVLPTPLTTEKRLSPHFATPTLEDITPITTPSV